MPGLLMRIYDNRTPEGRKVERPGLVICPECKGQDGRHGLSSQKEFGVDKLGKQKSRNIAKPCTRA